MSNLKKNIKENIVAPYNKYNLTQERIAEVIEADPKKNSCTLLYKGIDGNYSIRENVPCKKSTSTGVIERFPAVGDHVEVEESGKIIRITGVIEEAMIQPEKTTSDIFAGSPDYAGILG